MSNGMGGTGRSGGRGVVQRSPRAAHPVAQDEARAWAERTTAAQGVPVRVRLADLDPDQRRVILALIDAARAAQKRRMGHDGARSLGHDVGHYGVDAVAPVSVKESAEGPPDRA